MTNLDQTTALTPPVLNQGQHEAAEGFFKFLFTNERELCISGPGGVGKTFLMGHMIDTILPRYFETCNLMGIDPEYDEVHMTATTNKAADVLGTAAGRPTTTLASFLNLKVTDDYSTGQSKLTPKPTFCVHERKILFVDESSMVDTPLRQYIHKGTINSKIVYVGDHCQLAPIFEPISPVYADNLPFYELTEQMRTQNPDLMALNNQMRETVKTGVFKPIKIVPGTIDWLDDRDMAEGLQSVFFDQDHTSRILAYTNKRVMEYNDHIRGLRNLPNEYQIGETLINNSAVQLKGRMLSVEEELTIHSHSDKIEDIYIEPGVSMKIRRTTFLDKFGAIIENVMVPVEREHHTALIKYMVKTKNWPMKFELQQKYPDLRQRDASTIHKVQGSTHDSVFIDLTDISRCNNPNQVARMLYVALTRARFRVFLYGKLADKYGGLTY